MKAEYLFDFLENGKNFRSENKKLSKVSKVLSFRLKKQTSKNLVDTTFNRTKRFKT